RQIVVPTPPRLRALRPDLDPRLEAVVLRCLQKEPARRYPSAGELADELGRWLRGEPLAAGPESWVRRVWRRTRRRAAVGLGAALLVFFGVVLAVLLPGRAPDAPPPAWREPIEFLTPDGLRAGSRWVLGQGKIGPVK